MPLYITPSTALRYLMKTGLSKRRIAKYADIAYTTIDRLLESDKHARFETVEKLREAVARRQKELAADETFIKENGL